MDVIEHSGKVISITNGKAHVRIEQASACSGCHARNACMSADVKEKYMDCVMMEPVAVGDEVTVMISEWMGWRAVVIAYVMPFVVLVAGVTGLTMAGMSETVSGLGAIAMAVIYYVVAWLLRGKIERGFSFRVRKK